MAMYATLPIVLPTRSAYGVKGFEKAESCTEVVETAARDIRASGAAAETGLMGVMAMALAPASATPAVR